MNIVDSSGWLEYFSGGLNANNYEQPLSDIDKLIVPAITVRPHCLIEVTCTRMPLKSASQDVSSPPGDPRLLHN